MESANEKKGMQQGREILKIEGDELINSINMEGLNNEDLKTLEFLLNMYQDLLRGDLEINKMIAKNQKMQQWIFFFFAVLFLSEIVYSLALGSGYIEPVNVKTIMLVFIFFLIALGYSIFRN